jgi:hypothetical protein
MRWPRVLGALLAASLATGTASAAFDDLEKAWASFYATGLDAPKAMSVTDLTLQKDAMTLVFKKGILVPMQPIEGEITGAMFVGEGTATLTPPTPMDAWFLKKYYGADKFSESFTSMYLRFTDGTDKQFPKSLPGVEQAAVASQMDAITKTFNDRQGYGAGWQDQVFDMDLDFMDSRIGGIRGHDYFYAQFETGKQGWVTFLLNQGDTFEVRLGHERTVGAFKDYLPWAEFHKQVDYQQGRYLVLPASDSKDALDVLKTELKIEIPTTKTVEIDAKLTIAPLVDSLGSLRFELLNQFGAVRWTDTGRPITVVSVTDGSGAPIPYLHKRNELLLKLPKPLKRGEQMVVNVKIKEDTIIQATAESYVVYNTYPWYPQYGYNGGRYAFDFNIEVQKPLTPIGSGHIERQWENKEARMNGVELKIDEQVQFPSILFGRFQMERSDYQSTVSNKAIHLTVSAFPTMTFENGAQASLPQGKMKGIMEEATGVIKFYEEQLYGPFLFSDLNIAQMNPGSGYAQAPPALVQLDGFSFLSQEQIADLGVDANLIHEFLSHEIAHQYWGHAVSWANDHDAWLSESFAEYSAGLYFLAYLGPKAYEQKLANWKKSARQADPQGPIALSSIISGDNAGSYRTSLLYDKGPYVVHMIRTQMGDDNFKKAMKQILTKYKGQYVTTEMVGNELAAVTGYSWDYFFNQWFRGVGIPEIHYKYSVTPEQGKYKFDVTFTQKDKDNFKRILSLPIRWKGKGKDQVAMKSFVIKDPVQVHSVVLPFEPKSVEVDPDGDVLADYVQDK